MGRTIHFKVLGVPVPQGSMTCICQHGQPRMFPNNKEIGKWRTKVAQASRDVQVTWTRDTPLMVVLTFMLPPTQTKRDGWHIVKPDVDKLVRGVLDGMTILKDGRFKGRGVLHDDCQVVRLVVDKVYGDEAGVSITVCDAPSAYHPIPLPH